MTPMIRYLVCILAVLLRNNQVVLLNLLK